MWAHLRWDCICGSRVEVQLPEAGAFALQLSGITESLRVVSKADYHWPETTFYVVLHIFGFSDFAVWIPEEVIFPLRIEEASDKFPYSFSVSLGRLFPQSLFSLKVRVLVSYQAFNFNSPLCSSPESYLLFLLGCWKSKFCVTEALTFPFFLWCLSYVFKIFVYFI